MRNLRFKILDLRFPERARYVALGAGLTLVVFAFVAASSGVITWIENGKLKTDLNANGKKINSVSTIGIGKTADATIPVSVSMNAASATAGATGTIFQYSGANGVNTVGLLDSYAAVSSFIGRRAQGTAASKTTVISGNELVKLGGRGYDGTNYSSVSHAGINVVSSETWTTSAHGAYLEFFTTQNGSLSSLIRMRLQNGLSVGSAVLGTDPGDGNLLLGGNLLQTVGAGVPASAGAAGVAGTAAWDANFIYICTATNTWKRVAISTW